MSTVQFPNSKDSIPDFKSLAQSVKSIKRSAPAASDGDYIYFADKFKLASTVADELDKQITDALTSLPGSLDNMRAVPTIIGQIGEIDEFERAGKVPTDKAAIARAQLQAKLSTAVSSTIKDFEAATTKLSEPVDRLSNYAQEIEVRQKDALVTETSNQPRAKGDVEREDARLKTLEDRYDKLKSAVDKARGGPTEDLVELLPDEKELSSLVDVKAEDAAAPEVAAAKKAIELAVKQVKKILKLVDKTVEFTQLTEMCNEVHKAVTAQRSLTEAAQERLQRANAMLADLDTFKTTGVSMALLAAEASKLVTAFSSFATKLQDLDSQPVTADTLKGLAGNMGSYLKEARAARNSVILT